MEEDLGSLGGLGLGVWSLGVHGTACKSDCQVVRRDLASEFFMRQVIQLRSDWMGCGGQLILKL